MSLTNVCGFVGLKERTRRKVTAMTVTHAKLASCMQWRWVDPPAPRAAAAAARTRATTHDNSARTDRLTRTMKLMVLALLPSCNLLLLGHC